MTLIESAATAEQLKATLDDPAKAAELLQLNDKGEPEKFTKFVEDYVQANVDKANLDRDVRDQVRAAMTEMAQDGLFAQVGEIDSGTVIDPQSMVTSLVERSSSGGAAYNPRAAGAALDAEGFAAEDILQAAFHNIDQLPNSAELAAVRSRVQDIRNEYQTTVPADGGLLVPETVRAGLLQLALEASITRPRATVLNMTSGKIHLPGVEGSSNVSALWGGVQAFWEDEGAELTETQAEFKSTALEPKMLTALSEFTNSMISDAPALLSWFMANMPQALAYFEDDAFIGGNGVNKPHGWLNSTCAVVQAKETSQAANTIEFNNLTKMFSRMLPSSMGSCAWFVNQTTFPELANLKVDANTEAIWINNAQEGPPARIFGRPVIVSEKMEALGTEGDIVLADLRYYVIGDRQSMELTSSPHQKFSSNRTLYKLISRVDGRTWLKNPLTPRKGGLELSPIVKLETRA